MEIENKQQENKVESNQMKNNFLKYFVIKESPVGTIVLDGDWLKPGDKIYFNNNEIEITSLPKEMSDNSWIYVINRYVSFNVGDILYNDNNE